MLQICIIDDDKHFVDKFECNCRVSLIKRKEEFQISTFTDPFDFIKSLKSYDICFLDIEMPILSGLDLGKKNKRNRQ